MKTIHALLVFCLVSANAFAGAGLKIDKIEKADVAKASRNVAFSTLLEGTIDDPDLEVFVLVYQPHLKGWRAFPATTEFRPEARSQYRWYAICQFGELDGRGVGVDYQARAIALDRETLNKGFPEKIPSSAPQSEVIVFKRTK